MTKPEQPNMFTPPKDYTAEEINEIADWLGDLTLQQLFFLRDSYFAFIAMQTLHMESKHVH